MRQGKTALRISVCDHATDDADVAAAAQVVLCAVARNLNGDTRGAPVSQDESSDAMSSSAADRA
ncbi:MAG TPA: hypothetical protein VJS67_00680 [Pseudonocardiaceae bacterium]|nr:hypothetical protein [Pseudonocardiaceae bacterium]